MGKRDIEHLWISVVAIVVCSYTLIGVETVVRVEVSFGGV